MSEMHPDIFDLIAGGEIQFMINTPGGAGTRNDGFKLRSAAVRHGLCYVTTLSAASAFVSAIQLVQRSKLEAFALQDLADMGKE